MQPHNLDCSELLKECLASFFSPTVIWYNFLKKQENCATFEDPRCSCPGAVSDDQEKLSGPPCSVFLCEWWTEPGEGDEGFVLNSSAGRAGRIGILHLWPFSVSVGLCFYMDFSLYSIFFSFFYINLYKKLVIFRCPLSFGKAFLFVCFCPLGTFSSAVSTSEKP